MDNTYIESVWWAFKTLWEKGHVYQGKKVILYCPRCSTPLSNFEIAMDNSYKNVVEPSTTYKYPVVGQKDTYLLAWSTTPWNKLATPALAVNPLMTYVKVKQGEGQYILAESRLSMLKQEIPYTVIEKYTGKELESLAFEPHFSYFPPAADEKSGVVVADTFVTDEDGTGIVTLAIYVRMTTV
jgi:isoleucyl-tRNA synthetase